MRTHRDIWFAASIAALSLGAWLALCLPSAGPAAPSIAPAERAHPLAHDAPVLPAVDPRLEESLALSEIEQSLIEAEPTAAMLAAAREATAAR